MAHKPWDPRANPVLLVRSMFCPKCGADPDEPCRGPGGEAIPEWQSHRGRIHAWMEALDLRDFGHEVANKHARQRAGLELRPKQVVPYPESGMVLVLPP
jgi:hypothetical protein